MRNSLAQQRGAWATYVESARQAAKLSQAELGRRAKVSRETVWRWETEKQKPENLETVLLVARALGTSEEEAIQAAGFMKPQAVEVDSEPESEIIRFARSLRLDPADEIVAEILAGPWNDEMKHRMLRSERRIVDEQIKQRLEQIRLAREVFEQRSEGNASGVDSAA